MQLIVRFRLLRPLVDEFLNIVQLGDTTCFEPSRIVEYEAWIAAKYHLVLDIVQTTLR